MKKQRISPLFVTVWIIICAAVSFSLLQYVKSISNATSRLAMMESQTQELEKKNEALQKQIDDARSPFIREKMIRDQLGMQKPGEIVVQIVDAPNGSVSSVVLDAQKELLEISKLERLRRFFEEIFSWIKAKFIGRV